MLNKSKILALFVVAFLLISGVGEATTYTQQNVGYAQNQKVLIKQRVVEFDPRYYLGLNGYYTIGSEIAERRHTEQLEALQEEHRLLKQQIQTLIDTINRQPNPQVPQNPAPVPVPVEPEPQVPANPPPVDNGTYVPTSLDKAVYGIFKAKCASCHNENKKSGNIQLVNTQNGALLNQPLESRVLIERVIRGVDLKEDGLKLMPLNGQPLNEEDLKVIYKWAFEEAKRLKETTE